MRNNRPFNALTYGRAWELIPRLMLAAAFIALVPAAASAQTIRLQGNTSYRISGSTVTIEADRVQNTSSTRTTGTLRLQLWATRSPYAGGSISGYVIGTYRFSEQLRPNYYFYDVRQTVQYSAPPGGMYYVTLALEEYSGGNFYIVDYAAFSGAVSLGSNGSGGGAGGSTGASRPAFEGEVGYTSLGSQVTLRAAKVVNRGTGVSGSLRMSLWATASKYPGSGTLNGYILASYTFRDPLGPGQYYYDIAQTVSYTVPPGGHPYRVMALSEWDGTTWRLVDSVTFDEEAPPQPTLSTQIGVFRFGLWMLDLNGNGRWDQAGDRAFLLGEPGDVPVAGDWNGDGRIKAGVFRPNRGLWVLDYNGNGLWDPPEDRFFFLGQSGDTAVTGDWNGDGRAKAGVFRPAQGLWVLDYNGNGRWDGTAGDRFFFLGQSGDIPLAADWNGDRRAKAGIFRPGQGLWVLDYNGNGQWDGPAGDRFFFLGQNGDVPLAADWNGDRRAKAGVFRPGQGLWVLDYNGNGQWDGTAGDRFFFLGQNGDVPLAADWNGDRRAKAGVFRPGQGLWVLDYNGNGQWESGIDRSLYLGQTGDAPITGRW